MTNSLQDATRQSGSQSPAQISSNAHEALMVFNRVSLSDLTVQDSVKAISKALEVLFAGRDLSIFSISTSNGMLKIESTTAGVQLQIVSVELRSVRVQASIASDTGATKTVWDMVDGRCDLRRGVGLEGLSLTSSTPLRTVLITLARVSRILVDWDHNEISSKGALVARAAVDLICIRSSGRPITVESCTRTTVVLQKNETYDKMLFAEWQAHLNGATRSGVSFPRGVRAMVLSHLYAQEDYPGGSKGYDFVYDNSKGALLYLKGCKADVSALVRDSGSRTWNIDIVATTMMEV